MINYDQARIKVRIELEPGIYCFRPFSATGKSYLYRTLNQLRRIGCSCRGYTYEDYKEGVPFPTDCEVVVVDRYDMYQGKCDAEMEKAAIHGIVLVDLKSPVPPKSLCRYCSVELPAQDIILVR